MDEQRKYVKKVILKSENSSAFARAQRLRRIRNMCNLSREKLCTGNEGLNVNTYKSWEIARCNGLPIDGAQRVIKRVARENVMCNLEWLLHGQGVTPYIIPSDTHLPLETEDAQDEYLISEIALFEKAYSNVITARIEDDGLMPWYRPGDYVGGIKHYGSEIETLVGECCILETGKGQLIVRRIKKLNKEDQKCTLVCTNFDTSVEKLVLYNVALMSAAPITRLFRVQTDIFLSVVGSG